MIKKNKLIAAVHMFITLNYVSDTMAKDGYEKTLIKCVQDFNLGIPVGNFGKATDQKIFLMNSGVPIHGIVYLSGPNGVYMVPSKTTLNEWQVRPIASKILVKGPTIDPRATKVLKNQVREGLENGVKQCLGSLSTIITSEDKSTLGPNQIPVNLTEIGVRPFYGNNLMGLANFISSKSKLEQEIINSEKEKKNANHLMSEYYESKLDKIKNEKRILDDTLERLGDCYSKLLLCSATEIPGENWRAPINHIITSFNRLSSLVSDPKVQLKVGHPNRGKKENLPAKSKKAN